MENDTLQGLFLNKRFINHKDGSLNTPFDAVSLNHKPAKINPEETKVLPLTSRTRSEAFIEPSADFDEKEEQEFLARVKALPKEPISAVVERGRGKGLGKCRKKLNIKKFGKNTLDRLPSTLEEYGAEDEAIGGEDYNTGIFRFPMPLKTKINPDIVEETSESMGFVTLDNPEEPEPFEILEEPEPFEVLEEPEPFEILEEPEPFEIPEEPEPFVNVHNQGRQNLNKGYVFPNGMSSEKRSVFSSVKNKLKFW